MNLARLLFFLFLPASFLVAQPYTSYFTGSTADVSPQPQGGVVLMGGATEDDNAIRWFLNRASGGDVVVLRASGSDGYNDYFYEMTGITPINSVETLLLPTIAGSTNNYVLNQIRNADAIWLAGGDQYDYVSNWRNTPVEEAILYATQTRNAVIGGTSAGMAVMSGAYFSAQNGSVTSAEALQNPYNTYVQIGFNDFLDNPYLNNVITDTHYDDPDRRGRHVTFMARMLTDYGIKPFGIASEEYTAVCVAPNGMARVFGGYPTYEDYAYFIQVNCETPNQPEVCAPGTPLTWYRDAEALKVCKISGTASGSNTFNLTDWQTATGGEWQRWYVQNGVLGTAAGTPPTVKTPVVLGTDNVCGTIPSPTPSPNPLRGQLIHGRFPKMERL